MIVPTARRRVITAAVRLVGAMLCLAASAVAVRAETINLRLRIGWGEGEARAWRAQLRLSEGVFSDYTPLGLAPDSPGSIRLAPREVQVEQRGPRSLDGLDLLVNAPADARLAVMLTPLDAPSELMQLEIPLAELVPVGSFQSKPLDERGNRLLVRRAPGDELRVWFERDSLVFSPGEPFSVKVLPHQLELPAGSTYRCHLELKPARGGTAIWEESREFAIPMEGEPPPIGPIPVTIPPTEGAYDLIVTLARKRRTVSFVASKPEHSRVVQLMVVESRKLEAKLEAEDTNLAPWKEVAVIDPANPTWTSQLWRLSQVGRIPGLGKNPVATGSEKLGKREHLGRQLSELAPNSWQAIPLPISSVGTPHMLEIEYPSDVRQTLDITILDPQTPESDAPGLDSGLDVSEMPNATRRIATHRLPFWPRGPSPMLLLTNRRADSPAVFGAIRVLAGPGALPPAEVSNPTDGAARLLAAYWDRPWFTRNFCATEKQDPHSGQWLDDWRTFHEGGRRMVEYLRFTGQNAAIVTVAHEGSAIYPSRLLEPTSKYDTGIFFSSGQDAVRKDVLEMLLRMFDREGLKLIPAIQFSSPLPELEQLLRDEKDPTGITLATAAGRSLAPRQGAGPYYNPLDARVQTAMARVVTELVQRYGHHRSLGGVAIQLSGNSYAILPDEDAGADAVTLARFRRDTGQATPRAGRRGDGPESTASDARGDTDLDMVAWLRWRAEQLTRFHQRLQKIVAQRVPERRLYLVPNEPFVARGVHDSLLPSLTTVLDAPRAFLRVGIDLDSVDAEGAPTLLRARRRSAVLSTVSRGVDATLNAARSLDERLAKSAAPGALLFQLPLPAHLPDTESSHLPTNLRSSAARMSLFSPGGDENRRRFTESLAAQDALVIVDGGDLVALGQEDALRSWFATYRQLPAERFEDVTPRGKNPRSQPVVVRRLTRGNRTYLYLLNEASWPVTATLELSVGDRCPLQTLGDRALPGLVTENGKTIWRVDLEPFELAAAVLGDGDARALSWATSFSASVIETLRGRIKEVNARASLTRDLHPLDAPTNPDFEPAGGNQSLHGWTYRSPTRSREPYSVEVDPTIGYDSPMSLKITSRGPQVQVRSEPFALPKTGRLTLNLWIRIADPNQQPLLRVGVEGLRHGELDGRLSKIGAVDNPKARLDSDWKEYRIRLDRLPPDGMTEVRVALDLLGPGEVWIDQVRVHELWFSDAERNALLKETGLASIALEDGRIADCQRFLDGYWPAYLREHVALPSPQLVDRDHAASRATAAPSEADARPAEKNRRTSALQKWLPPKMRRTR